MIIKDNPYHIKPNQTITHRLKMDPWITQTSPPPIENILLNLSSLFNPNYTTLTWPPLDSWKNKTFCYFPFFLFCFFQTPKQTSFYHFNLLVNTIPYLKSKSPNQVENLKIQMLNTYASPKIYNQSLSHIIHLTLETW